jgi:hypothetical protein
VTASYLCTSCELEWDGDDDRICPGCGSGAIDSWPVDWLPKDEGGPVVEEPGILGAIATALAIGFVVFILAVMGVTLGV